MNCSGCGRDARKRHQLLKDHPGTVVLVSGGMCWSCTNTAGELPIRDQTPDTHAVAGLEAYLARRRERLSRMERVIPRRRVVAA